MVNAAEELRKKRRAVAARSGVGRQMPNPPGPSWRERHAKAKAALKADIARRQLARRRGRGIHA